MKDKEKTGIVQEQNLLTEYPVIALRGLTIFPGMLIQFDLNRKKSIAALQQAVNQEQNLFCVAQKTANTENPPVEELCEVGTLVRIKQITKMPQDIVRVMVEGIERARLVAENKEITEYISAFTEPVFMVQEQESITFNEIEAMDRTLAQILEQYLHFYPKVIHSIRRIPQEETSKSRQKEFEKYMDIIAVNMPFDQEKKQQLLETTECKKRYELLTAILVNETQVMKIREKLAEDIKDRIEKNQKEYILREQLAYLKKELQEDEDDEDNSYSKQLDKLQASDEIKGKIAKEIKRFEALTDHSQEGAVERGYIETLLELPWDTVSEDNMDLTHAQEILDKNHYGMDKIKERILEFLAVRKLTKQGEAPILCLVGPPGTGKTSIARSVAQALEKKYVRICLGGMHDEAEIRGHRRTYVGAMPGRSASSLKQSGVKNPLILLDEIDKAGSDYKGDVYAALLEVLDPDQNCHFMDHYVELPIDLSSVLFIATANSVADIPRPLLDRMELIEVSGYTENEKFHIAKEYLVQKQQKVNGMTASMVSFTDTALTSMIRFYTREAGVRELERKIGMVCRKSARIILQDKKKKVSVTGKNLPEFLGKHKYTIQAAARKPEAGIVRGLAWTAVGGETLQIEANRMPGKGEIELTGQMGDVMKESAQIAYTYVRCIASHYGIKPEFFKKNDFHIHIPEGAVPKDGPSAGITMATAILSIVTGRKVRADIAMTGEITLRGKVLPIGGLKEKLLAAKAAGIKEVLVPAENESDIEELDQEVSAGMKICYVKDMQMVEKEALV